MYKLLKRETEPERVKSQEPEVNGNHLKYGDSFTAGARSLVNLVSKKTFKIPNGQPPPRTNCSLQAVPTLMPIFRETGIEIGNLVISAAEVVGFKTAPTFIPRIS